MEEIEEADLAVWHCICHVAFGWLVGWLVVVRIVRRGLGLGLGWGADLVLRGGGVQFQRVGEI